MQRLLDLPMKLPRLPHNAYDVHSVVYDAMMYRGTDAPRDFLFSMFPDLGGMVVIRSANLPDHLKASAFVIDPVSTGEVKDFSLVACPMKSCSGNTKPLPINDPESRLRWLDRMGKMHGFSVTDASVTSKTVYYERKGSKFWLERAEFDGSLVVTDETKMNAAIANGIGRAKSLGHGMMRWI